MKATWFILIAVLVILVVLLGVWLVRIPGGADPPGPPEPLPPGDVPPLRIALVPERDIFAQRRRYLALTDYLEDKLGRPVELITVNTYLAVLKEFADKNVDAAFLGSLVAVLTLDRLPTRVLVKPEVDGGVSTYRGVIVVPGDSPIRDIPGLAGRSIAMVKTTTAGDLFPVYTMFEAGLLDSPEAPKVVWVGTHDEVAREVAAGRVDAGSLKNLRLDAFEQANPDVSFRRLAESPAVPNNALVVSEQLGDEMSARLAEVLLGMTDDPAGRDALAAFGAERFVPCQREEFRPVCRMITRLGGHWEKLAIVGPPPRMFDDDECEIMTTTRPATQPATQSD